MNVLSIGRILPDHGLFVACYNPDLMLTGRLKKRTAPEIAADILSLAQEQGLDSSPQKTDCNELLAETGLVSMEVEVESEQAINVEITDFPLPEKWDTHYLDIYAPTGVARVRIKNGQPRFSNKLSLLPPDLERQKCCLRIELKPVSPEGVLAIWQIALQFLAMPGCQVLEKTGLRIQLTDGTEVWLNFNGERYWIETDGRKPIEQLLPQGIEFRGYQKSTVTLGPPPLYNQATFTAALWKNLEATSRTANGVIDTSVSAEKAALFSTTEVDPLQVQKNVERAAQFIWETRSIEFITTSHVQYLYSSLVALLKDGMEKDPNRLRTWDKPTYEVQAVDVPDRLQQFFPELLERYHRTVRGLLSPAELALWIEWEFDHVIHPLADGCGRLAKTMAAYFLSRFNQVQPDYSSHKEYYDAMNSGYETFKQYYQAALKRGANQLSLR